MIPDLSISVTDLLYIILPPFIFYSYSVYNLVGLLKHTYMKSERIMLACLRKADFDYGLIEKGDKIMLGLSGGKDSMALAHLLHTYQKFSDKDFTFVAAFMDLGFPNPEDKAMEEYLTKNGIPFTKIDAQDVYKILSCHRDKDNLLPCSICSRMKKAVINKAAHSLGITKVAFAHHADDAIETLMMNMTYGGRVATFAPKMTLTKENITFIRPLIYAREKDVTRYVKDFNIPVFKNNCGNDKKTEREDFKGIINGYYKKFPPAYDNFLTMLSNQERFKLFFDDLGYAFGNGLFLRKVELPSEMASCFLIRKEVFIKEQKVSVDEELDDLDNSATHFLLLKDNKPIGTMRIFLDAEKHEVTFGRIAILKEYRGQGYGRNMVSQVMKIISRKVTPLTIRLNAQEQAEGFYKSLGFIRESEESFLDANIVHYHMINRLKFPIPDKEKI